MLDSRHCFLFIVALCSKSYVVELEEKLDDLMSFKISSRVTVWGGANAGYLRMSRGYPTSLLTQSEVRHFP